MIDRNKAWRVVTSFVDVATPEVEGWDVQGQHTEALHWYARALARQIRAFKDDPVEMNSAEAIPRFATMSAACLLLLEQILDDPTADFLIQLMADQRDELVQDAEVS